MKIKLDKGRFHTSLYVFLTIAILILFFLVVLNFSTFIDVIGDVISGLFNLLSPFILGSIFAYFIFRPMSWVEKNIFHHRIKKEKIRRILSILLIYIIIFIILGTFLYFSIPRMIRNITDLVLRAPLYIETTREFLMDLNINQGIQNFIHGLPVDISFLEDHSVFNNMEEYVTNILDNAQEIIENIIGYIINSAVNLTSLIFNIVLAIFIAFYILMDKEALFDNFTRFFYAFFPKVMVKKGRGLIALADKMFGEYLVGNIIDSAIIGMICFIGMVLLNIRFSFLISLIVGISNLIPYFGPIFGAIPGIVLTLFDSPIKALWVALFILALQQFDGNYLKPKVLGDKVGLGPLWVIFAIIIGGGLFGVLGMFLGVPVVATIRVLLLEAMDKKERKNNIDRIKD